MLMELILKLIKKQEAINSQTSSGPLRSLPVLREAQEKLRNDTDNFNKQLDKASGEKDLKEALAKAGANESALKKASENVDKAGGEMKRSSKALGQSNSADAKVPQDQAVFELKEAEKKLTDAIKKMGAETPSGQLSDRQGKLGEQTRDAAGKLNEMAEKAGIDPKDLKGSGDKSFSNTRIRSRYEDRFIHCL